MTKDTITHDRLSALEVALQLALEGIRNLRREVETGDVATADAAETVREIAANVAAASA